MPGSDSTVITIFVVSTLVVLVFVVIVVSFVLLYQRRILQQQMRMRDREVGFQRELLAATLESQERERERIAKDLHDSVGVMLSTLNLTIRRYGSKGEPDERRTEMVDKASDIISGTIATVRRISHNLLPPELEMLGLKAALERLAEEVGEAGGLKVSLKFPMKYRRLPVRHEMLLFRIAQELLNNTMKHSGASEASIALERSGDSVTFSYSDNGIGLPKAMEADHAGDVAGLGLNSIESRARTLGAELHWDSERETGMALRLRFRQDDSIESAQ